MRALLFFITAVCITSSLSETCTWKCEDRQSERDFTEVECWSCGRTPRMEDEVVIQGAKIVINEALRLKSLRIMEGGSVRFHVNVDLPETNVRVTASTVHLPSLLRVASLQLEDAVLALNGSTHTVAATLATITNMKFENVGKNGTISTLYFNTTESFLSKKNEIGDRIALEWKRGEISLENNTEVLSAGNALFCVDRDVTLECSGHVDWKIPTVMKGKMKMVYKNQTAELSYIDSDRGIIMYDTSSLTLETSSPAPNLTLVTALDIFVSKRTEFSEDVKYEKCQPKTKGIFTAATGTKNILYHVGEYAELKKPENIKIAVVDDKVSIQWDAPELSECYVITRYEIISGDSIFETKGNINNFSMSTSQFPAKNVHLRAVAFMSGGIEVRGQISDEITFESSVVKSHSEAKDVITVDIKEDVKTADLTQDIKTMINADDEMPPTFEDVIIVITEDKYDNQTFFVSYDQEVIGDEWVTVNKSGIYYGLIVTFLGAIYFIHKIRSNFRIRRFLCS